MSAPRFSWRMKVRLWTSWLTLFLVFSLLDDLGLLRLCMPTGTAALSEDGLVLLGLKRDVERFMTDYPAETEDDTVIGWSDFFANWHENDTTPCAWFGVSCTAGSDRVQGLRLSGWSLGYFNFSGLSSLPNLEELDLSSNLVGSSAVLPPDLSYLGILEGLNGTRLSRLDLSSNFINSDTDIGSKTITGLRNLRYLSLERTRLYGPMPNLDCFPQLQYLSVAGNYLYGSIPRQHFRNSTNLVSLDLSQNNFSGDIPDLLGLTYLRSLNLSHNQFTGFGTSYDEFVSLKGLRSLDISGNRLQGAIPSGITNIDNINILDLSGNQLSGEIPQGIRGNSTMLVNLSNNMLSGTIPSDLLSVPELRLPHLVGFAGTLNLSRNCLVGALPEPRTSSTSAFGALDLSYNALEGTVPALLQSAQMWLQHTQLGGNINDLLQAIRDTPFELRGEGSAFHGELNMTLMYNCMIEVLDLSNTTVTIRSTSDYPYPLQTMLQSQQDLRELRLAGTDLRELRLAGTNLTPDHESWLNTTSYSSLEVLDLSNSSLGGALPDELFNGSYLPALRQLNLSSNRLQGRVPASIAQLARTIVVDLSNNPGLCGDPLPPCSSSSSNLWVLLSVIIPSVCISVTSLLLLAWRWRVYSQRHKQDADLIATLLQSKDNTMLMSFESPQEGYSQLRKPLRDRSGRLWEGLRRAAERRHHSGSEEEPAGGLGAG